MTSRTAASTTRRGYWVAGGGRGGRVGVEWFLGWGRMGVGGNNGGRRVRSGQGIAQVVEHAPGLAVAVGAVAAARAGPAAVVAALAADLGFGQILDAVDALAGVGAVFAGSWHGASPGRKGSYQELRSPL